MPTRPDRPIRRRAARLALAAALAPAAILAAGGVAGAGASPAAHPTREVARRGTAARPAPADSGPSAAALAVRRGVRADTRATGTFVTVEGHGDGHGRGMGQWGAYGYASEAAYHWSAAQILAHYYGGTTLEPLAPAVAAAPVKVNLTELDTARTTVVRAARTGAALRVNGGRRLTGTTTVRHTGATRTIRATSGDVAVRLPGLGWRSYRGYVQIQPDGQTWNVVGLEQYVAGVVPAESVAGWGATGGEAALQAQAVAARSYGLAYVAAVGFTCDSTACQVYDGDPGADAALGADAAYSNEAGTSTAGQVMCTAAVAPCPSADIAFTEFSASTGGWSAGQTFPAVVDRGDAVAANPAHDWSIGLSAAQVQAAFPAVGTPTAVAVTARNGHGQWGGRATTVVVTGTKGSATVSGDVFAEDFSLLSDWYTFVPGAPAAPPVSPPTTVAG